MSRRVVAVIDIGSNSIKSLAAARDERGALEVLGTRAIDARISAGLSRTPPRLAEAGMQAGLEAIRQLLDGLRPLHPDITALVATSAVRDAANGAEFAGRVRIETGQTVRILGEREEADLVGRGLLTDPALTVLRDFYVFDLGGGSLECLAFRARTAGRAISLPLGCVRLTERCVADPRAPFPVSARAAVGRISRETLDRSAFRFDLPRGTPAVFTGGTMTTVRAILAAGRGLTIEQVDPVIAVEALRTLLDKVAAIGFEARAAIGGLPAARADVFPAALTTVLTVAEAGGFTAFHHSIRNLRYGLAAELLET